MDLSIGALRHGPYEAVQQNQAQIHALAENRIAHRKAINGSASREEIDAILAAVPRGCRAHATWAVPLLLQTARHGGITHPRRIAYLLATAHHCAHFGARLVETAPATCKDGTGYFDRFEPGTPQGLARGNIHHGDGERFRGRGFVHIKGRTSYATWSQRLNLPDHVIDGEPVPYFIAHPQEMGHPEIAAQTLVRGMRDGLFTGIALGSFVNDKKTDYFNARRVVDGTAQAREVAALAVTYQHAIEHVAHEQHRKTMQALANHRETFVGTRDLIAEVRDAVDRLALRGEMMACPTEVLDWNGEARQGKFVQLDERTCALHMGRGVYIRLDIQRDLNGIVPPEGKNLALKRSGDFRATRRSGETDFWR